MYAVVIIRACDLAKSKNNMQEDARNTILILLSALLMIYNDKNNSTRLVFIDEPFAKMDPVNVKIMLGFMKEQKLQMVFCAPDKTDVIGDECNVILPVLRKQQDLMEIGIVEMHENKA